MKQGADASRYGISFGGCKGALVGEKSPQGGEVKTRSKHNLGEKVGPKGRAFGGDFIQLEKIWGNRHCVKDASKIKTFKPGGRGKVHGKKAKKPGKGKKRRNHGAGKKPRLRVPIRGVWGRKLKRQNSGKCSSEEHINRVRS